ncbi:MAG: VCBS repeat-containing protein [Planctomycetes bacterium]|nr:VCBS repeat-containing protein [Planctomycetota bacterium]
MNPKPIVVPPPRPVKIPWMLPVAACTLIAVVGMMIYLKNMADQLRTAEQPLVRPEKGKFVTDLVVSENTHDEAMKAVKGTFLKGLRERDWAMVASGMADGFTAHFPGPQEGVLVPDALVTIRQYSDKRVRVLDKEAFIKVMKAQIGPWAAVERAVWRAFEFLLDPGGKRAFVSAHFQLAGRRPDGGRADLQGVIEARVVQVDNTWKVKQFQLKEGWLAEADFRPFSDVTDQVGLSFNESEERTKVLEGLIDDRGIVTLGGLTVADFNRDGFPDVLASAAHNDAIIFMNDGKGGFQRQPVTTNPAECGYCWLYVDLDHDGVEELVSSQILRYEGDKAYGAIYKRKGDAWELQPDALVFPIKPGERDISVQGIVPYDIDGNGELDLFFCVYSNRNSKGSRYNRLAAFDGADNYLMMNKGHLVFSEESDARGLTGTQYTYVAKFWDFDFDGDADLLECNDFGPNHLWVNDGKGHFTDSPKDNVFNKDSHYTMGVTIADYDNTGDWSVNLSDMYSHAGNRIVPLMTGVNDETRRRSAVVAAGNQFYEYSRQGRQWTERGVERGVNWADWAWGSVFWDPDNDGDRDIFVANGFTTNKDKNAPDY